MVYRRDLETQRKWGALLRHLENTMGKKPRDLNNVLFLIGVQELGKGMLDFSKEEKQDLIHIAICKILSYAGFYQLEGHDADGWPHWQNLEAVPKLNLTEQEHLLKIHAIEYFEKELMLIL
jgi:hypothetical protein